MCIDYENMIMSEMTVNVASVSSHFATACRRSCNVPTAKKSKIHRTGHLIVLLIMPL